MAGGGQNAAAAAAAAVQQALALSGVAPGLGALGSLLPLQSPPRRSRGSAAAATAAAAVAAAAQQQAHLEAQQQTAIAQAAAQAAASAAALAALDVGGGPLQSRRPVLHQVRTVPLSSLLLSFWGPTAFTKPLVLRGDGAGVHSIHLAARRVQRREQRGDDEACVCPLSCSLPSQVVGEVIKPSVVEELCRLLYLVADEETQRANAQAGLQATAPAGDSPTADGAAPQQQEAVAAAGNGDAGAGQEGFGAGEAPAATAKAAAAAAAAAASGGGGAEPADREVAGAAQRAEQQPQCMQVDGDGGLSQQQQQAVELGPSALASHAAQLRVSLERAVLSEFASTLRTLTDAALQRAAQQQQQQALQLQLQQAALAAAAVAAGAGGGGGALGSANVAGVWASSSARRPSRQSTAAAARAALVWPGVPSECAATKSQRFAPHPRRPLRALLATLPLHPHMR